MKVIIAVTDSFSANLIRGQAAFLQSNGCNVLIVGGDGNEIRHLAENENCHYIKVNFSKDIAIVKDLISLFQLINIIRTEKPDIVNAGNPKPGLLFSIALLLFPHTKYVFTLRGLRSDTLVGIKRRIVKLCEYTSCLLSDKVIVISPSLRQHAIANAVINPVKSIVIGNGSSNGINLQRYTRSDALILKAERLRKLLKITEKDYVFLYVGRLAKDKGLAELCEAFSLLKLKNSKLLIAGPNEHTDPLDSKTMETIATNSNIIRMGKVKSPEILYAASNTLILFSHREGFGNVVLEAAAMGIPAIVSDIPGLRDTVVDNYTGLRVRSRDVSALMDAMRFYRLQKKGTAVLHGENARKRVHRCFDQYSIWQGQLALYSELHIK